ncbi:MAG: DNA/RNA endonuclease [Saprospirales bacterium]|nr:DNA/RNA endonuclease [Saprospirales bacterium]
MAKFRTNHRRKNAAGGTIVRIGFFALIVIVFLFSFKKFSEYLDDGAEPVSLDYDNLETLPVDSIFFLPSVNCGKIITHRYYALSYCEEHELAEWVAYELLGDRLRQPWVKRTNDFREDPKIKTGTSDSRDFRGPEFDRGHLVPAADMAFNDTAMSQTFFMSNISPQRSGFNKGVWRELEELTRDWAKKFDHLYVVSGPVFTSSNPEQVGRNDVSVPDAFFKVLLDLTEPELKGIAFLIPNQTTDVPLEEFATSIDSVESVTGIDFFYNLLVPKLEEELESSFNTDLWPTNPKKYRTRVRSWNKQ